MELFLQTFFSGITVGSVYALVGLGFTLVYLSTFVLNIAQGEFVMLGGLTMVTLTVMVGLPWPLAFIITLMVASVIGGLFERLTLRPVRAQPFAILLMITVGAVLVFQGVAMVIWGKLPQSLPHFFGRTPLNFMGAVILPQVLWVLGLTLVVLFFFTLFLNRTMLGRALRACAENQSVAALMGINVGFVMLLSVSLSAALGAVAGILVTPLFTMSFYSGIMLTLKGTTGAVLGGLDRYAGPVVGGLLLGLLESYSAVYIHGMLKDALALSILILVLLFRPRGLLGGERA